MNNREKKLAACKRWRVTNREHVREYARIYGEKLRSSIEYQEKRKAYLRLPEQRRKALVRHKRWRKLNKEKIRAWDKKYNASHPWIKLFEKARRRCRKSGLPFDLTNSWASARWTGRCELSGLPFAIGHNAGKGIATSPSLDRIDPKKGYIADNCRFILWSLNRFKGDGTDAEILAIARALARSHAGNS